MRSKKDPETIVIVTGSPDQVAKVLTDNAASWEPIPLVPRPESILDGFPLPMNRAERRGGVRCPVDRAPCDREMKECSSCSRNKKR